MPLNKQSGNMYPFVTHTWNAVKGKCPHDCLYCYMKDPKYNLRAPRLDKMELGTKLGKRNFIFVGSSCDMWAWTIPDEWISLTLLHTNKYPKNTYLFQSKTPDRFRYFYGQFPPVCVFGTTIESNREYPEIYNDAPAICDRYIGIHTVGKEDGSRAMISIEPILDFDVKELVEIIFDVEPEWVSIGADSKGHKMPEPNSEKICSLIYKLRKAEIEVKLKKNLKRLIKDSAFLAREFPNEK